MISTNSASPSPNAIAQCLEKCEVQWSAFTSDPDTRLLRWLCRPDEAPVVEAFVFRESDADGCVTPDLFIRFDDAFEHPTAHGYALCKTFLAAYEEAKPAFEKEDIAHSFVAPQLPEGDDVAAFVSVLQAYFEHQGGEVDHIVVLLHPESVNDHGAYQHWLQRLAHTSPETLRAVHVDWAAAPQLEALATSEPALVLTAPCNLDMQGAMEQVAQEANTGTPGGQLRELFVKLGGMAKLGDVAGALPLAQAATALAVSMQCPHLAAGVQVLLAGIYATAQ